MHVPKTRVKWPEEGLKDLYLLLIKKGNTEESLIEINLPAHVNLDLKSPQEIS